MSLLAFSGVSFAYTCGCPLFEDVSFSVNPGDRIAIVGPNGAGKSTLLRLLAGELPASSGEIARRHPLLISVAGQGLSPGSASTIFDFAFDALGALACLRKAVRQLETQIADPRCACEYASRINDYEEQGGYAAEAAVARILGGLGYRESDFERDIRTLSGGERTRAALARALSVNADVLILDEPTNHLDISARE